MPDCPLPWPPPKILDACTFRAPRGAQRVIPHRINPGTERIELITDGTVYHEDRGTQTLAHPGTMFWHLPGEQTVHRYPPDTSYECLCINLAPADPPRRLVPRCTVWPDVPAAQAFAREVIDGEKAGQLGHPAFVAYVYYRLYWNALGGGASARPAGPTHLADACAFIRANLAEGLSVADVARSIGISGAHLHHLFRAHLARTPHGFILEERFRKACHLLRGTRLQSKEIAYQCGFRDAAEFSRSFRRLAGCSPREYRLPFLAAPADP